MSFTAFKTLHLPTGIENCAAGFITHSRADSPLPGNQPIPNLITAAGNVLELYLVRVHDETRREPGASLELVSQYYLHGNVETLAILSGDGGIDSTSRKRDSIILTFEDSKISVMEFDDSINGLRPSSMHCFEGPDWIHLRKRAIFSRGPLVKSDPQGRCAGVLVYGDQMILLNSAACEDVDEDHARAVSSHVKSSYIINLRDLNMNSTVKDFVFIHGYSHPVIVILHMPQNCMGMMMMMISAFSIDTSLKQQPQLIWSGSNLPHCAYKLLAVPLPIGGVLVISPNTIHYHNQLASCVLGVNKFAPPSAVPRSSFEVELDAANASWLSNDVAVLSTKTGELLLVTLVYDGRAVQRLDLLKSKASVLTSDVTTVGDSFLFLGSRLGDSLLVEFSHGNASIMSSRMDKEEAMDIEGDLLSAKRLRISSPDVFLQQKAFSFEVRDSLVNVGPIKDFSHGSRRNADPNAMGAAKQSNYEMVCCSGHGKNGALCVLQQSIRPELITEAQIPGSSGIWTVYYRNSRSQVVDEEEYHAYLIISLDSRTMILEASGDLQEVTETVGYYVLGKTITAGNLFGRRRVVQVYARGARILDGPYMTQEVSFPVLSVSENSTVLSVSIADPYVLLRLSDGTVRLLTGDPATCNVSARIVFDSKKLISASTLYHDKGPKPWLRTTSTGGDQVYCVVCYENGTLEIFDVPSFTCVFSSDKFVSGKSYVLDTPVSDVPEDSRNLKVVELAMKRWPGKHSRPFLWAILSDGTILCYHAYKYEEAASIQSSASKPRLGNLRFGRVSLGTYVREEASSGKPTQRLTVFENVGGYRGFFLSGSRPTWFMICRERLRIHPQLCDGAIVAFTALHNVNCNRGLIYVTAQGVLKISQLPSQVCFDNYWPVKKIPLKGTPHQVTYFPEKNLYPVIVSVPCKPVDPDNPIFDGTHVVEEFEIRVMEQEKSSGSWRSMHEIKMQLYENALTVRALTLNNTTTKENETLLAIGTAYMEGEDVAARGRVLLFSFGENKVSEVYAKEMKGAMSAVASFQGNLLISSGRKIVLHKWNGSELNPIAFYDDSPLYIVSLNILKNFILLGDVQKSVYFIGWSEQQAKLSLMGKDFGSLDCLATEFLVDGSTLSFAASDEQKNVRLFYYAPKLSESWKGQKLLSRAEFHVGAHVTKFLRLQMVEKSNRYALVFGTLAGSVGCIAPVDEVTFRRLQSLQNKLVDAVPHVAGLNPKSFRQFRAKGNRGHRPGPDSVVDCDLVWCYEMISLEEQVEIAHRIGTTREQILSNLKDLAVGTSFF